MKKNIYLVQPTTANVSTVYFPYAIGCIASYAWSFEDICEAFELKESVFLREEHRQVIARLESPYLIGFSNYLWNFEYNKALAKKIKEAFPECIIVFGGPQIPADASLLETCSYIDMLQHYEGEVSFRDLLRALASKRDLGEVHNLSFRQGKNCVTTDFVLAEEFDFPSPYQSGYFDKLMLENPEITFEPLIETNRGCPHKCAYCSWGMVHSKVRQFPLERVFADLEWCAAHQCEFVGFADANFGMFERDEAIVDKIIELKHTTGYPKKFQVSYVSYSKGSWERVFRITKKLNENEMDKGVTLSFQSMSPIVQTNIGRSNMNAENYKKQMRIYADAGIPTYTDLILGLPGETLESYKNGIEELLEMGQHTALFVHLCEWLPLAQMGSKEYMKRFDIRYTEIPLNQPHVKKSQDGIIEHSRIITSTNTMSTEQWVEMNLFSTCVLCFHHLRLLQFVALYLHDTQSLSYTAFYAALLEFLLSEESGDNVFKHLQGRFGNVIRRHTGVTVFDDAFGDIAWPSEEYAFLKIVTQKQDFFGSLKPFLIRYIHSEALLEDLLAYQCFCLKEMQKQSMVQTFGYDWKPYFDLLLKNQPARLRQKQTTYEIEAREAYADLADYAKRVVWFGRRGGTNIYTSELKEKREKNE